MHFSFYSDPDHFSFIERYYSNGECIIIARKFIANPPYSPTERMLAAISLLGILWMWIYYVSIRNQLSALASSDFLNPFLYATTMFYLAMTAIYIIPVGARYIHCHPERVEKYRLTREMILWLTAQEVIIGGFILWSRAAMAMHHPVSYDWEIGWMWVILTMITLIINLIRIKRCNG